MRKNRGIKSIHSGAFYFGGIKEMKILTDKQLESLLWNAQQKVELFRL